MHTWKWSMCSLFVLISVRTGCGMPCTHVPEASSESITCEPTDFPKCKELGYNSTHFPNVLDHLSQTQARQIFSNLSPSDYSCSEYLIHFLCSTAFPLCAPGLFSQIGPCRELCSVVRESCRSIFDRLNIDCNKFQNFAKSTTPCIWNSSECNVVNDRGLKSSTGGQSPGSRVRTNCTGHLTPLAKNALTRDASFAGISLCTESCQGVYFDRGEQNLIVIWIAAWSLITLFVSAVIFLTYILNFKNVQSLETPIYYIALCYAISALCYTLSVAIGSSSLICDSQFTNQYNESAIVVDGLSKPLCVSIFGLLYYFTACTWSWWAVLCIEWLLCSLRFADVNNSWKPCFHITALGLPLPFLVVAISLKHVSGDTMLHTCWIKKHYELPYLIVPLSLCILWCSIIIIVSFAKVVKLQKFTKHKERSDLVKPIEHQTLVRVGLYCTVYMLPMGALLCVYFYEYWFRQQWELDYLRCSVLRLSDCANRTAPLLPLFLTKIAASLLMGIVSVFWMFKRSTVAAWRRVCCFYMISNYNDHTHGRCAPNMTSQEDQQSRTPTSQIGQNSTTHKHTFNSESPSSL